MTVMFLLFQFLLPFLFEIPSKLHPSEALLLPDRKSYLGEKEKGRGGGGGRGVTLGGV